METERQPQAPGLQLKASSHTQNEIRHTDGVKNESLSSFRTCAQQNLDFCLGPAKNTRKECTGIGRHRQLESAESDNNTSQSPSTWDPLAIYRLGSGTTVAGVQRLLNTSQKKNMVMVNTCTNLVQFIPHIHKSFKFHLSFPFRHYFEGLSRLLFSAASRTWRAQRWQYLAFASVPSPERNMLPHTASQSTLQALDG